MAPRCYEAFIYEPAFISMVVSAVEVYPRECLGTLLGYRAWNSIDLTRRAIVENAISYQTAKRKEDEVEIKREHEFRCKDMLYKLCALEFIGDFHSHPDCDTEPSDSDKNSMKTGNIEIIIAVNPKKRSTAWRYDINTKTLTGVFGEYRFAINAYSCYKENKNVKHEKIDLTCPFALGIGSKYMDINASISRKII